MAYNTRRNPMPTTPYAVSTSASSVGQRRPGPNPNHSNHQQMGKNFGPGGQLMQPNKPPMQKPGPQQLPGRQQPMQQGQQPKPQQQQPIAAQRQQQIAAQQQQQNLRQQAQQFLNQQQQQQPPQVQKPPPSQQQQQQQVEQPKIVFKTEEKPPAGVVPPAPPVMDTTNGNDNEGDTNSIESNDRKQRKTNRPFWLRKDGKINKKERLRRRNQRLRKILQPKNALMVLNELIGSAPYNLSESPDMYEGTIFRCTVQVDGIEHIGIGKSKPSAKTAAAEAALKHMVLSKLKNLQAFDTSAVAASVSQAASLTPAPAPAPAPVATSTPTPTPVPVPVPATNIQDVDVEKMDVDSEDGLGGISWSHVACYALHKLLSSWDEGTNIAEKLVQVASGGPISAHDVNKTFEKKPAKKLPETAGTMNPIMLLNQMHPNATYEEVSKTGNPPNVEFTIKCTVVGEAFLGTGPTKKAARKMCAFAACRKVLGIQYSPPFLEENGFNEDAISVIPVTSVPVTLLDV